MNTLGTCAAGMNLKIAADIVGSVKTFYEGGKTKGSAWLENTPDFLRLFPDGDRISAYRLYLDCVLKIVGKPKAEAPVPQNESCLPLYTGCASDNRSGRPAVASCQRYADCDPNNPSAQIDLGNAFMLAENASAAGPQFQKAVSLAQTTRNPAALSSAYVGLARVSIAERRLDQAERYVRMSIDLDSKENNSLRLGIDYVDLGEVLARKNDLRGARAALDRAAALLEPTGNKLGVGRAYSLLGDVIAWQGDRRTGCPYLVKARQLFTEIDFTRGVNVAAGRMAKRGC